MKLAIKILSLVAFAASCSGSVTILTGGQAKQYSGPASPGAPELFYRAAVGNEFVVNSTQLVFADFDDSAFARDVNLQPSSDSFVRGAIQAWAEHLHLVIRPDEFWFAILIQMTYYMNSHPELIRDLISEPPSTPMEVRLEEVDWYVLVHRMRKRLQERYKVDWLADWVNPGFTSTLDADFMTASIIMLGSARANFEAPANLSCGLPSVTLQGIKSDWEAIDQRLDRLPLFGPDAGAFRARLRPILKGFIASFETPDSQGVKTFWNKIVSSKSSDRCRDAPGQITGWLTGLFFWDDRGRPFGRSNDGITLDNQTYPVLNISELPASYSRAAFGLLAFNGTTRFESYIMAGNLCKLVADGPPDGYFDALNRTGGSFPSNNLTHSTLTILSSWAVVGPVLWNATGQEWSRGPEPVSLEASIQANFNKDMCTLKR